VVNKIDETLTRNVPDQVKIERSKKNLSKIYALRSLSWSNTLKDGSDASHFRPISLLSVVFKLLERLILQRMELLIDAVVPDSQAGFRKHRSCTKQVLALTYHIEAGFERKLKTGTVFINLTAAQTVSYWRDGLMLKFIRVVPCAKSAKLMNNMLSNRFFKVSMGDKSSIDGVGSTAQPQGSVLAPIMFSLYLSDFPSTLPKQF
jgi:Reverse transcriptase (RNA-dependent DNA polymerase)